MTVTNWIFLGVGLALGSYLTTKRYKSQLTTTSPASTAEELKHIKAAYLMAGQMSLFKGGFLARISHELRAPLNGIIGTHQLILTGLCDSPEEEKEFLIQANQSSLKLVNLMDTILAVAKIEHGTEKMELMPLRLAEIFSEVENLTHLQAEDRNLKLKIIQPESEIYVLADKPRFVQFLVCLIDENLRLMKQGILRVWTEPSGELVDIIIESPAPASSWQEDVDWMATLPTMETPISPNFQLSPGLCLLMSQIVLELMGSRIIFEPGAGETSRFRCSIPQCNLPAQPDLITADYVAP